jgi:hypothetical protein
VTAALLGEVFPRRDDYVLATKVCSAMSDRPNDRGLSRKHIMSSIDDSLRRLGTDHVDLYQIHRFDSETPIEETMEAPHDVVKAGKARYIGASSMYAWQFAKAQYTADLGGWTRFVSMQDHYNLIYREEEREMHPLCLDQGVGVIPWSPLARGRLARVPERRSTTTRSGSDPIGDRMCNEGDDAVVYAVADVAKAGAFRSRRRRSPGCCTRTRSPRRSSGPRSPATSRTRWRPSTSSCPTTRSPRWKRPTSPTRFSATGSRRTRHMDTPGSSAAVPDRDRCPCGGRGRP